MADAGWHRRRRPAVPRQRRGGRDRAPDPHPRTARRSRTARARAATAPRPPRTSSTALSTPAWRSCSAATARSTHPGASAAGTTARARSNASATSTGRRASSANYDRVVPPAGRDGDLDLLRRRRLRAAPRTRSGPRPSPTSARGSSPATARATSTASSSPPTNELDIAATAALRSGGEPTLMTGLRLAVDTGGTFTDLVIEGPDGPPHVQEPDDTRRPDPRASSTSIDTAAADLAIAPEELLGQAELFIHGTTRAINAILTGRVARTAFLTTKGHPDILLFREGGRTDPFNFTREYPPAYVPRALTFEVPERIGLRRRDRHAARRSRRARHHRGAPRARRSRRSRSASSGRSPTRARAARRRAAPRAPPGRAVHALARPQPEPARVSPRLVDRDRRIAEADHDRVPGRPREPPARRRLRRPRPDGHVGRRRARRRRGRRRRRSTRSARARRWRPSPAATTRTSTPAPTPPSSPTPAARATTSASCDAAGSRGRGRPGSGRSTSAT